MKKLLYVIVTPLAVIAAVLVVAALQPAAWHVERSVAINAPRPVVWRLVSDLSRFGEWSPYAQRDPAMTKTITGTPGTAGATYTWDGNKDVGAGKMTIANAKPNERVDIKLDFLRPFPGTNAVAFILADDAGRTRMTWAMDGVYEGMMGVIGKAMTMVGLMDKMVGKDFDSGLATVKAISEKDATDPSRNSTP